LKHFAAPSFWEKYDHLPENIRNLADQSYAILFPVHIAASPRDWGSLQRVTILSHNYH
jgi:hypothetical protein